MPLTSVGDFCLSMTAELESDYVHRIWIFTEWIVLFVIGMFGCMKLFVIAYAQFGACVLMFVYNQKIPRYVYYY